MTRALDNIENVPTGQLKQRKHELNSELALVSKKNIKLKAGILADKYAVITELAKRTNEY